MIGKRIKYYRLKKGLTIEELAKAIDCTKAAVSLYENGEREPNPTICKNIAKALGVSWIQLLSRTDAELKFDHNNFRKIKKASNADIEILKEEIENECSNRVSLLNILNLTFDKKFKHRKLSFKDDVETNAKKIRQALGLPITGPIYSVTNVLEHSGIIVLSFKCAEEIDGINGSVNGIPYVFFNSNRTIERQRFTLIHEVCHLFFDADKENEKAEEKYINCLAGNVLVPTEDIYKIFGKTNRNITFYLRDEFAREYKVAPSCLVTRLFETGVVPKMFVTKHFMHLNKRGGKKLEKTLLDEKRDSEQPTIFIQQVYLALSEDLITKSKAAEFLHKSLYDVMQNTRVE